MLESRKMLSLLGTGTNARQWIILVSLILWSKRKSQPSGGLITRGTWHRHWRHPQKLDSCIYICFRNQLWRSSSQGQSQPGTYLDCADESKTEACLNFVNVLPHAPSWNVHIKSVRAPLPNIATREGVNVQGQLALHIWQDISGHDHCFYTLESRRLLITCNVLHLHIYRLHMSDWSKAGSSIVPANGNTNVSISSTFTPTGKGCLKSLQSRAAYRAKMFPFYITHRTTVPSHSQCPISGFLPSNGFHDLEQ